MIIAVLAAGAIPRVQQAAYRLRAERAAADLAHLFRAAHEQAVAGARPMTWRWDEDSRRATVAPEPATEGARVFQTAPVPAAIEVALKPADDEEDCSCVRFFPDSTSDGGVVTLSAPEGVFTLTVDAATGDVSLTAGPAAR